MQCYFALISNNPNQVSCMCWLGVTVQKIHGSLCALALGSQFGTILVQQREKKGQKITFWSFILKNVNIQQWLIGCKYCWNSLVVLQWKRKTSFLFLARSQDTCWQLFYANLWSFRTGSYDVLSDHGNQSDTTWEWVTRVTWLNRLAYMHCQNVLGGTCTLELLYTELRKSLIELNILSWMVRDEYAYGYTPSVIVSHTIAWHAPP